MRHSLILTLAAAILAGCAGAEPGQVRTGKPSFDATPHHGPGTPNSRRGGR